MFLHENGKVDCFYGVGTNITERKRSEEALRESESKYRRLYDSMMEAFVNTDMSGRILETNRAFQALLGYSEEELKQLYYTDLTPQNWHVFESEIVKNQIIPRGYSDVYEKEYRKKDGTIFPVELRTFLLRDPSGQPIGMWAIIRDLTERKRAEGALRESEKKHRTLFDNAGDAIFIHDVEARILEVNPLACERLGFTHAELMTMTVNQVDSPKETLHALGRIAQLMEHGHLSFETLHRRKDGSLIPVEVNARRITWDGQPAVMSICRDITERKREEKTLRESEARYRTLIENIPQAVLLKDRESRYISINKAYALAFGLLQEEVIGKSDYDYHQKHFADKFRQEDRLVMETGEGREFEEESVHNGQKRIYYKVKVPVRDSMGKIIGVLSTLSDITERKQAEEALRALSARQEAILAAVPEIIMEVDCNKVYTWANRFGVEFFGEDVIGKEAAFYFEGEQDTYGIIQPLFNGNDEVFYVESWQRRRDGQKRLLAWWCRALKDAQGTMTGALAIAHDITDQRRAEEELRESEARFRVVIEGAPDAIFVQSAGRFTYLNPAACRLLGASGPKDLLGKHFMERIAPEYHDRIRERIRLQLETGKTAAPMEQTYLRLDGSQVPVETTAVSIRYQGEDAHLVFVRDITERKRASESLRLAHERMEWLARFPEENQAPVARVSAEGRILYRNPAIAALPGWTCEAGQTPPESLLPLVEQALSERQVVQEDVELGGRFYSVSVAPFTTEGYANVYGSDITERKKAEEELRASQQIIEGIINAIPVRVFWKDKNLVYLGCNAVFAQRCGICRSEGHHRER